MNKFVKEFIIIIVCLIVGYGISKLVLTTIRGSDYNSKAYNCDYAEFHPDFPKEVKQKCTELKNENRSSK